MGFFDFLKKGAQKKDSAETPNILTGKGLADYIYSNLEKTTQENLLKALDRIAKPDDDLEHLTKEGDLPWGWHTHNKDFIEKINAEYSYFFNTWLEARNKSPKELYSALNSFVLYLDDLERLCKSKGECFEWWFYNDKASKEYIAKRTAELDELTANLDELQTNFVKRNKELSNLDERIIKMLIEHPDVLQSNFVKMFDPLVQNDVREKLYFMDKLGKLKRTKSGRSYTLHYIG